MTAAPPTGRFSEGLILAAGSGARLKPLTDTRPKPLIEIAKGKPILEIIARNAQSLGVETLWIVTLNHSELFLQAARAISDRLGIVTKVHVLPAPTRSSLETLRKALPLVTTPPAVFLGDDVTLTPSLAGLADRFRALRPAILEAVTPEDDVASLRRTCSVQVAEDGWILDIAEKPREPTSRVRGCGIYLLGSEAVDFVSSGDSAALAGLTELVGHFARSRRAAYAFFEGVNINVNTVDDLRLANEAYTTLPHETRVRP